MYDPHVITKDELIEMLKPFNGHEKICIKIDTKSIPDSARTEEDGCPDMMRVDDLGEFQFAIDKARFENAQRHPEPRVVLEAFAL